MVIHLNNKTNDGEAFARNVLTGNAADAVTRAQAVRTTALGRRLDRLAEYYWAGRNRAHRKSARFAASTKCKRLCGPPCLPRSVKHE